MKLLQWAAMTFLISLQTQKSGFHATTLFNTTRPHLRARSFPLPVVASTLPPSFSLGTLSKDVFEARTSTGSEAFSLFICLDANKLVLLSFFSLLKTIYPRVSTKSFPSDAKSPLPVDVRRSKTLLLKLPSIGFEVQRSRTRSFVFFLEMLPHVTW